MLVHLNKLEQSFGVTFNESLRPFILAQLNRNDIHLLTEKHLPNVTKNELDLLDSIIKEHNKNIKHSIVLDFYNGEYDDNQIFFTKVFDTVEEFDEAMGHINEEYGVKIEQFNMDDYINYGEPITIFGYTFHVSEWYSNQIKIKTDVVTPLYI